METKCYCTCAVILSNKLPYIANHSRWKSFTVFADLSVLQNFSSEIASATGLAMQDYHPTVNVSSKLKFSFETTELFYLERFVIYGISIASRLFTFITVYLCYGQIWNLPIFKPTASFKMGQPILKLVSPI